MFGQSKGWQGRRRAVSKRFPIAVEVLEDLTLLSHIGNWVEQGPRPILNGGVNVEGAENNPVAGAIEAIAAHPTDADIVYIGGVGGGVWKTENATDPNPLWRALTDDQPSLAISDLVFDPRDATYQTLYAGTGSFSSALGGQVPPSRVGILKTNDGGNTWTVLGQSVFAGLRIVRVVPTQLLAPLGGQVLLAAAEGGGIFRSTDGGQNWVQVSGMSGVGDGIDNDGIGADTNGDGRIDPSEFIDQPGELNLPTGTASDLIVDPGNVNRFFAAIPGQGVFRSEDGGVTWQVINFGLDLNSDALDNDGVGGIDDGGEEIQTGDWIELAAHTDRTTGLTTVYAAVVEANTSPPTPRWPEGRAFPLAAVFVSTQTPFSPRPGDLWVQVPDTPQFIQTGIPPSTGVSADHFSFTADRDRANVFYVGGEDADDKYRVEVGPVSTVWQSLGPDGANGTNPHKDSRLMVFDANGDILQSDDGGLYRLENPAGDDSGPRRWVSVIGNLGVTEFASVAYDPFNRILFGGNQDNGGVYQNAPSSPVWTAAFGADGGDAAAKGIFEDRDGDGVAELVGSIRFLQGNGGNNFLRDVSDADGLDRRTPERIVPGQGAVTGRLLYALNGGQVLRPADAPGNVRMLLAGSGQVYESFDGGDTLRPIPGILTGGDSVSALDYGVAGNPAAALLGTQAGAVLIRQSAGGGFSASSPGTGFIQHVAFDPSDSQVAYVVYANNTIWRTTNGGTNWLQITGMSNLFLSGVGQLETIKVLRQGSARLLLVGGSTGISAAIDNGAGTLIWTRYGTSLPNVFVDEMSYDPTADLLVAATTGRGAWVVRDVRAETRPGSIFGVKFHDLNGNGVRDADEIAFPGWMIYIDTNENGSFDVGEPNQLTAADGSYAFTDLVPGHYTIREEFRTGWIPTGPSSGQYDVALGPLELFRADFGNAQLGGISGLKYLDANADGMHQATERALQDWVIYLDQNGNGELDSRASVFHSDDPPQTIIVPENRFATAVTTSQINVAGLVNPIRDLDLRLDIVPPRNVTFEARLDFDPIGPAGPISYRLRWDHDVFDGVAAESGLIDVTYDDESNEVSHPGDAPFDHGWFGDQAASLTAFEGLSANGTWTLSLTASTYLSEEAEPASPVAGLLRDWSLVIQTGGENAEPMVATNAAGKYIFFDLPPGTYTVAEEPFVHWLATSPDGGRQNVDVESGTIRTDVNFGNSFALFDPKSFNVSLGGSRFQDKIRVRVEPIFGLFVQLDGERVTPIDVNTRQPVPSIFPRRVEAFLGAGPDVFTLLAENAFGIQFDVFGEDGDDRLELSLPFASGQVPGPIPLRFDSGAGADSLSILGTDEAEQFDISAMPAPQFGRLFQFDIRNVATKLSIVELISLTVTDVAVTAAGGDDVLNANVALDANWSFSLGDGNDRVWLHSLVGDGRRSAYAIDAGEGDNHTTIRFGDGAHGQRPALASQVDAEYRSGAGADVLDVTYAGPVEVIFDLLADTGGGKDWINVAIAPVPFPPNEPVPLPVANNLSSFFTDIASGSGDDLVTIIATLPPEARIRSADFRIDTAAGHDRVKLDLTQAAFHSVRADVSAGPGADQLDVVADMVDELSLAADLGTGNDRFFAFLSSDAAEVRQNVEIAAGPGHDTIEVVAYFLSQISTVNADFMIDLGAGRDDLNLLLQVGTARADVTARLDGGSGRDRMAAVLRYCPQTAGSLDVVMRGGRGRDDLELAIFGGDGLNQLFAFLDGGPGFDIARATRNVKIKDVERLQQFKT